MPFTSGDIVKRQEVLAKREAAEALARAKQAAHNQEKQETTKMLESEYPHIPQDEATTLWYIAVSLTNSLVDQFVRGCDRLEAQQDTWASLFFWERHLYSNAPMGDKGYAAILTRMARQYNDVSQDLSIRVLMPGESTHHYVGRRVRVTATVANLPG